MNPNRILRLITPSSKGRKMECTGYLWAYSAVMDEGVPISELEELIQGEGDFFGVDSFDAGARLALDDIRNGEFDKTRLAGVSQEEQLTILHKRLERWLSAAKRR